jgi:hypothetical protein
MIFHLSLSDKNKGIEGKPIEGLNFIAPGVIGIIFLQN